MERQSVKNSLLAALSACMLVVSLESCTNAGAGSVGLPTSPSRSAATHLHSWMAPGAASGDLLYISDAGYGAVFVYTYSPFGMKFAGVLAVPHNPGALCVDKAQNVWVLSAVGEGSYAAVEYAHGGTDPIAMLVDPAGEPTGCAADPVNGDLAIGSRPVNLQESATIALFKHERGKPVLLVDSAIPGFYTCCTYDHNGDLFGYGTSENEHTVISELPRGSTSFAHIALDRELSYLEGIQWVGKYLTVGETDGASHSQVLRYEISSGNATYVDSAPLNKVTLLWQYYVDGSRIIAPNAPFDNPGGFVGLYHYPLGGAPIRMQPFSAPVAVVVSRAPH
jgi:hypothetical protein